MSKNKLDENVDLAESLFTVSEEVREMVNTMEVGKQRHCIIQAIVHCLNSIEEVKKFYKITKDEIDLFKFVEEEHDFDSLEF